MGLSGILLGLINILLVIVILLLFGAIVMWVLQALSWPAPLVVQRLFLAVVALIALYLLIALLLGEPAVHLIGRPIG